MGMTWSEYKAYREKKKKEETKSKTKNTSNSTGQSNINTNRNTNQISSSIFSNSARGNSTITQPTTNNTWSQIQNLANNNSIIAKNKGLIKEDDNRIRTIAESMKPYWEKLQKEAINNEKILQAGNEKHIREVLNISDNEDIKEALKKYASKNKPSSNQNVAIPKDTKQRTYNMQILPTAQELFFNDPKTRVLSSEEAKIVENLPKMSDADLKAKIEADEFNKIMKNGTTEEKFYAIASHLARSVESGAGKSVAGITNLGTTVLSVPIKGAENISKLVGNKDTEKFFGNTYDDVVDFGAMLNENTTHFDRVNARIDNPVVKYGTGAVNTATNVATNYLIGMGAGVAPTTVQGVQVAGSSAQEELNKDREKPLKALTIGALKGYISKKTEDMFDANILTRGEVKSSIQDLVDASIKNGIKSTTGKKVVKKATGIIGENLEEIVEDNIDNIIDWASSSFKDNTFKNWWDNTSETVKATTVSTILMDMIGMGGGNINDIETDLKNKKVSKIDIENAKQVIQNYQNELLKENNIETINQETKTSQNQTSQAQNDAKTQTTNNLAKVRQFYDEDTYNQMKNFIETAPSEEALNQINEDIKTETKNRLEETYKSERFTESQERKRTYAQYQRQNNTTGIQYDNSVVDNALDTVAPNRNGRRTVGQWKQVAEQIGLNSTDLTKSQIDDIAYGSWFDLQPTKNITKYDNRTKEHKGFEKFTSDDWINTIYESAKGQKLQKLDTVLNQSAETTQEQISREDLLNKSNELLHKGEIFVDDRFAKGLKSKSNIIKLENVELKTNKLSELRKLAQNLSEKFLNTKVRNEDTNIEAKIGRKGIKETTSKDISKDKVEAINQLPKIIKEAVYKNSSIDTKEKNNIYHYLVALAQNGNDEQILNYITLKETPNGTKFHYNTTEKIEDSSMTPRSGNNAEHMVLSSEKSSTNNSIPQNNENVKSDNTNINNKVEEYLKKTGLSSKMSVEEFINKAEQFTLENETNMTEQQKELYNIIKEIQDRNTVKEENVEYSGNEKITGLKEKQNEIIQKSNPRDKTLGNHTWINSVEDIKTYQEAIEEYGEIDNLTPDFTAEDVKKALDTGEVTVYSSYPIEQGTFVTPSKMEAQSYAGNNQVYSKNVKLEDVAWIDEIQGQYAQVNRNSTQDNIVKDNKGRLLTKEQQGFFKDSAIRVKEVNGWKNTISQDGNLFEVYHGTNNGEFNIFDPKMIGSSNDVGWYGKGFYFAFTEGEAKSYGKNVLKAYLNIKNPFNFSKEMQSYDGVNRGDVNFDFGAFLLNLNEKFPDIAKSETIDVGKRNKNAKYYEDSTTIKEISLSKLAKQIKKIYESPNLKIVEIEDNGKTKYCYAYGIDINKYDMPQNIKDLILKNAIYNKSDVDFAKENLKYYRNLNENEVNMLEKYFNENKVDFKTNVFGYEVENIEELKKNRLSEATKYVLDNEYSYVDRHMPEVYMQSFADKITEDLKEKGYDGVIQSDVGDEIVAFYPEQIKSVDNQNPTNNPDILKEEYQQLSIEGFNNEPENNLSKENWNKYQESKKKTNEVLKKEGTKVEVEKRKFSKDFIDNGYIDLNGKTIKNASEVADMAQIFRNPKYETFRVIYMQGNTIVGQEAVSSKTPSETSIYTGNSQAKGLYKINNRMERLGADGYYLIHNHPTGVAKASNADIQTTNILDNKVKGFLGHVIINSGTYALIEKNSESEFKVTDEIKIQNYKADKIDKMLSKEPWANTQLKSRDDILNLAYDLKNNPNYASLILTDSRLKTRIVLDIPNNFLNMTPRQINGYIRNIARQNGANHAFFATQDINTFQKANILNTLQDCILYSVDKDGNLIAKQSRDKDNPGHSIFQAYNSTTLRANEKIEDIYNSFFNEENQKQDIRLPMKKKQEVKAPIKQENTKVKFDNEVMKTNSEIKGNSETSEKVAKILSEPTKNVKPEQRTWAILKANFIDKGAVFEKISQKTNNRDLQGKYDYTLTAGARGQYAIGNDRYVYSNGKKTLQSKSLTSIMDEVGENTQAFNEYMYHQLNVDRMTLDERFGIENKPVFGESITADVSRAEIAKIEEQHPEFKEYANDVYKYLEANKQELVDRGVISQETSDFFKERYPHYVPIQRATRKGNSIDVALDTKRTGINSPIKKAKGGNQDINPLFQTMASQTLQTYRASARNNFGLELKNTLQQMNQLNENRAIADIDDIVDTMTNEEQNNELLQPGKKGENPTFTVFEDGKKITYDISQDMYDALKPKSEILNKLDNTKLAKTGRKVSNFRRGVLTEYNPIFSITNAIKDAQDVLINSQHSAKTYAKFPEAYAQIVKKGYWYNEYIQNGGEQNSYFTEGDFENIKSSKLDKAKNVLKFPLEKISQVNNVIEMAPRLAEYIVSRQNGANIETAMLDASRVTTNFKAGGDITKFANRNGATFLNASVQGFQQQVRNIQEANMKGLKGWTNLALKYTIAGLPALLLNNLFWDDDDDYEQLQDYVKDNYYVIAKLPNGNFLRIPKGRMTATIQKVVSNANDFVKDGKINSDDVASTIWNDLKEDVSFGMDNLAPNNPIDNNILSPIIQVAQNKTWYGDDLVPQRLQDVPDAEQADESTDKLSRWLGEKLGKSPKKINYLLDQYSGGIGDVLLPLGTPQAENNVIEDKFTTDPVMKSQYPSDFFSKVDELNVKHNSIKATDEDILKYKYISSVQQEVSSLYKQKREIQASDKSDATKKQELKEVQKQINKLAKDSLENVDNVKISGESATIGDKQYYKNKGTWTKLTDKEKEKLNGTSTSVYSDYKNATNDLSDKEKIQTLRDSNYSKSDKSNLYEKTISTDKYYPTLKKSGIDIDEYMDYKLAQSNGDFTADKKNGKTVMGSGKKKVINYLNKNITGYGNRLLIAGKQYSLTASQRKDLSNYINKTFATQAERTEVYKQLKLNFVVNGNKVTYK